MGLFDDIDLPNMTEVEDYVPGIPVGRHEVMVSHVKTEQKDTGLFLVLTYTVTDEESEYKGKNHQEWQRIPDKSSGRPADDLKRDAQYLKSRLISLGVPPEKQNAIDVDDLVGIEGVLTLEAQKAKPEYRQVKSFVLFTGESGLSLPTPSEAEDKSNPYAGMLD